MKLTRREIVESCIVKGLLVASVPMASTSVLAMYEDGEKKAQKATAADVLGPFYKKGAPNTSNLRDGIKKGFPLRVAGKVVNTKGEKVHGARIDIWHADHEGLYDLTGYRCRTQIAAEAVSEYVLETIMPGHYDDRPAQHIHYFITAPGHKTLVTQAYFATDPWFDGDPDKNYNKRGLVGHRDLVRPVTLYEAPGTPRVAINFDICLEKA